MPELHLYYWVEAPDAELDELAAAPGVPPDGRGRLRHAGARSRPPGCRRPLPCRMSPPDVTQPDAAPPRSRRRRRRRTSRARQGYLDAAPAGIDARYAWTRPGGSRRRRPDHRLRRRLAVHPRGSEGEPGRGHRRARPPTSAGATTAPPSPASSAAIATPSASPGSAPTRMSAAARSSIPAGSPGRSCAAADLLRPGDIILIEVQYGRSEPRATPRSSGGRTDFAAIRYAVNRGVIVVEAAGNGGNNLDDPIYNTPLDRLPAELAQPVQRGQSELRRGHGRRGRPAVRDPRPHPAPDFGEVYVDRARLLLLQLRQPGRLPRAGAGR